MKIPKNMLVETVMERKGERFIPVEAMDVETKTVLFKKIPNMVPVGVFVGINDAGAIRVGFSRCKLSPAVIPEQYLKLMRHDEIAKYESAIKNSDEFNKERGIAQALQNILLPVKVPTGRGFGKKYEAFKERCYRYFKDVPYMVENGKVFPRPVPMKDQLNSLMKMVEKIMGPVSINGLWDELPTQFLPTIPLDPAKELRAMQSRGRQNRNPDGSCDCANCRMKRYVGAKRAEAIKKGSPVVTAEQANAATLPAPCSCDICKEVRANKERLAKEAAAGVSAAKAGNAATGSLYSKPATVMAPKATPIRDATGKFAKK